jgi:2-dehydro-3-deoxygluconokinase
VPDLDVLAFGEPMAEFNQTEPGVPSYVQGFGGDTSNFAIAAARQGARAGYLTVVGDDVYGRAFLDLWRAEGVDAGGVTIDPEAPTGLYIVTHDEGGHHFTFYRAGSAASRMTPAQVAPDRIAGARLLHLSGISFAISQSACDACYAAIMAGKGAGRLVSFDTNLRLKLWGRDRARAVILDVMSLSDICLPSLDDVAALTGTADPDRLVDLVLSRGSKVVALKLGRDGAIVADANGRHRIPPYPVTAVDATGAGDTFGGAFVARWLQGDDLCAAGCYAAVAAALSTTGYGAVEPIPRRDRVEAALAAWKP